MLNTVLQRRHVIPIDFEQKVQSRSAILVHTKQVFHYLRLLARSRV